MTGRLRVLVYLAGRLYCFLQGGWNRVRCILLFPILVLRPLFPKSSALPPGKIGGEGGLSHPFCFRASRYSCIRFSGVTGRLQVLGRPLNCFSPFPCQCITRRLFFPARWRECITCNLLLPVLVQLPLSP